MMLLVGVDAGATRCRALAASDAGDIVGRGEAGPANPHNVGPTAAAEEIARAVRRATRDHPADSAVAGVAGTEDPVLRESLRATLQKARIGERLHLYSDAAAALDGAFLGGPGIVVIAGTGAVAWGRDAQGREARAGGWGHQLDDAGSGHYIGRRGLAAVLRAHDRRGLATALTPRLLEELHVAQPQELVRAIRSMAPSDVAALAASVLETAATGDAVAVRIVQAAADELARAAAAVWDRLSFPPGSPVAGVGGLFEHQVMRRAFAEALARDRPDAVLTPPRLPPAGGALWRAFILSGSTPDDAMITRLQSGIRRAASPADAGGRNHV